MNPLVHLAILSSNGVQDTPESARRRAMLVRLEDDARRERRERTNARFRRAWTVVVGWTT